MFPPPKKKQRRSVACTGDCQSLSERWCLCAPPPVSMPTTTSRHRSPAHNSAYFTSFWWRGLFQNCSINCSGIRTGAAACCHCAPDSDVHCQLRSVVDSRPEASTSIARSSVAGTSMFMSRSFAFNLTVAPTSRHTRARVRSVGGALERRRPERGHAARCCPRQSRGAHTRNLSRTNVRNKRGFTRNSGAVGDPCNTRLAGSGV